MSEMLIDLGWLADLHTKVGATTSALDGVECRDVRLPEERILDDGVHSFFGRWDERSGQLSEALQSVSQLVAAIHDSFEEADTALADAASGENC